MGKISGIGAVVTVDNASGTPEDISNSTKEFDFATPLAVADDTGVDKSAMERLALLQDFSCTLKGEFDTTTNKAHDVLSGDKTVVRTVKLQVSSGSTPYLSNECLQTSYNITLADSKELTWEAAFVLQSGTVPTWTNS